MTSTQNDTLNGKAFRAFGKAIRTGNAARRVALLATAAAAYRAIGDARRAGLCDFAAGFDRLVEMKAALLARA